jgi:hypothetical protein
MSGFAEARARRLLRFFRLLAFLILFLSTKRTWALQATEDFRIDGFVAQGYLKTSDNNALGADPRGTFNFNSYSLLFKADVTDRFQVWSMLFSSWEIKDSVFLDWAFGEYIFNDRFHLKVGKIPLPIGIYNEIRDITPVLPASVLPGFYSKRAAFSPRAFKGLSLLGSFHPGETWGLSYDLYGGYGNDDRSDMEPLDNLVGARLWAMPPIEFLRFGASYFHASEFEEDDMERIEDANYVGSIEYHPPTGFNIRGEMGVHRHGSPVGRTSIGYYVEASYLLKDRWLPMVRYDAFFPDRTKDSNIADYQKDWMVAINYRFSNFLVLKVEEHFIRGVALLEPSENPDPKGRWNLFATSVSFLF